MASPTTTIVVKLSSNKHTQMKVHLEASKDPNIICLGDTKYSSATHACMPLLIVRQMSFLRQIEQRAVKDAKQPVNDGKQHDANILELIPKLWRAHLPPATSSCSVSERGMLASMVTKVQLVCEKAAKKRREEHATWLNSAFAYADLLKQVRDSETQFKVVVCR
jgi:hypothetical protein